MGIFNNIFRNKKNTQHEERGIFGSLFYNSVGGYATDKAMLLSAVYRCVDVVSDSVAQLPLEPFLIDKDGYKTRYTTHPSYWLLNKEPNKSMSRFTFIKTLIVSTLLRGNGYAYIERNKKGDAISLQFIPAELVTVLEKNNGDIMYAITGFTGYVESCNMIHILNFSYDGKTGVSTLTHAANSLSLSTDSEAHASGFFKSGANVAGILTVEGVMKEEQKEKLRASWAQSFNAKSGDSNGVAVLSGNMQFQPISVKPSDAQLLETRAFNIIDVCRFFGVSPIKCFDFSKASYSTVEATQLAFLTDTLSPLLEKIELEFERKLYKPSEKNNIDVRFDTSVLLRADKASLSAYYNTLFNIGAITTNEIRMALDLPQIEDGDNSFIQVNMQTLKKAVNQDITQPTDTQTQ